MDGINEQYYNQTGEEIFDKIGFIEDSVNFLERPEECPHCGHHSLHGIEIIGACIGSLYWECGHCLEGTLKYDKEKTINYLENTRKLYINLENLATIWEELPN